MSEAGARAKMLGRTSFTTLGNFDMLTFAVTMLLVVVFVVRLPWSWLVLTAKIASTVVYKFHTGELMSTNVSVLLRTMDV
jgi:hypothetical protein